MNSRISRMLSAFALYILTAPAGAAIISSGDISGHSRSGGEFEYGATGSDVRAFPNSHHEAYVTTDGIRLSLTSTASGFFNVTAGVTDTYTVTGGTPGGDLALNAYLNINGDSANLFTPILNAYFGHANIDYGVGLAINPHPLNAGLAAVSNPVIDTGTGFVAGQFGVLFGTGGEFSIAHTTGQKNVNFDVAIPVPLQITVGEPFILAVSVGIDHGALAHTDMLGTATLSFDLPTGYGISSELGFVDAAPVPLPSALLLALAGIAGLWRSGLRPIRVQAVIHGTFGDPVR